MHMRAFSLMAGLAFSVLLGNATPPVGVTSEPFRNPIVANVFATQWAPSPLFNLILQTSNEGWGYDLAQIVNTFAPANADQVELIEGVITILLIPKIPAQRIERQPEGIAQPVSENPLDI